MSSRTTKKVIRNKSASIHYANDKSNTRHQPKNRSAGANRSMKKLRELLCQSGEKTDGESCIKCSSPCRFGEEYQKRQKEGERP